MYKQKSNAEKGGTLYAKILILDVHKNIIMNQTDYLKKEIRKTGYPLEIEISSLLDNVWQDVVNTDTYYDKDEGKLRDIDIHAFDVLVSKKVLPIALHTGLVIECKKDEDFAWVFFSRPFEFNIEDIDGQYVDEVQTLTKNTENYQIMDIILEKTNLHYKSIQRKAVTYNEFYLKGKKASYAKKKREIFEAQNQLKKYIACLIEQMMKASPQFSVYPIELYFPCIVFDGVMYEAIVKNGGLELEEAKHLVLRTLRRSPYSVFEKSLLIDVVQKSYFKDYLKLVRKDVTSIRRIVRNRAKRIIREIEQVGELLSSSRTKS